MSVSGNAWRLVTPRLALAATAFSVAVALSFAHSRAGAGAGAGAGGRGWLSSALAMALAPAWVLVLGAAGPLTGLAYALQCGAALALVGNTTTVSAAATDERQQGRQRRHAPERLAHERAWILVSAAAAWRLWGRHYFYATGHHNNFNKVNTATFSVVDLLLAMIGDASISNHAPRAHLSTPHHTTPKLTSPHYTSPLQSVHLEQLQYSAAFVGFDEFEVR